MLNRDFDNGRKLNLYTAFSVFIIMMGFLFLIDAQPGEQTLAAVSLTVFGVACYLVHHAFVWWEHQHHH